MNLKNNNFFPEFALPYQGNTQYFPLIYLTVRPSHLLLKILLRKLIVAVTAAIMLIIFLLQNFSFRGGSRAAATSKMERFVIIVNG